MGGAGGDAPPSPLRLGPLGGNVEELTIAKIIAMTMIIIKIIFAKIKIINRKDSRTEGGDIESIFKRYEKRKEIQCKQNIDETKEITTLANRQFKGTKTKQITNEADLGERVSSGASIGNRCRENRIRKFLIFIYFRVH